MDQYSTKIISQSLLDEIAEALKQVSPYGSVEIYVQDNVVTQITIRNIKKTASSAKMKELPNLKSRMFARGI